MNRLAVMVFLLFSTLMVSGCSPIFGGGYQEFDDNAPSDYLPDSYWEPDPDEIRREQKLEFVESSPRWSCRYSETFNYDWHDDVVCGNGIESHRPYLLEGYDFVTYDDIMGAAADYEMYLNSQ